MREAFIGRQPILGRNKKIFGYELLFRNGQVRAADVADDTKATARVMVNTLNNIGIEKLIGDKRGFVNVNSEILGSDMIDLLPKNGAVLEILESVVCGPQVVEDCKRLRKEGYLLALDDFVYDESWVPLLRMVNYVKLDVLAHHKHTLPEVVKLLKRYPVQLLAEKVETREDFERCLDLRFDLFQGYFFAKPSLISRKSVSPLLTVLMELYRRVAREEEFFVIEGVFKKNPELYVKLLKFMNSASFYRTQRITSIRHSISLLGYRNLLKWVTLLLYAGEVEDIASNPLLERAALRGRMMELMARRVTADDAVADSAFITGALSLFAVLLQMPIEEILNELNLSSEIADALVHREGLQGSLLIIMEKLEQEQFSDIITLLRPLSLTMKELFSMENSAIMDFVNLSQGVVA